MPARAPAVQANGGEPRIAAHEVERVERIMIGKVTSVAVAGDKRLEVGWDDGLVAPFDLSASIAAHKALAPKKKKDEFARVKVG
jgi:hypothetical protein